jgi:hypothetical protein
MDGLLLVAIMFDKIRFSNSGCACDMKGAINVDNSNMGILFLFCQKCINAPLSGIVGEKLNTKEIGK